MLNYRNVLIFASAAALLGGCASTVNRERLVVTKGGIGKQTYVDAKQRVVLGVPADDTEEIRVGDKVVRSSHTYLRVCAEPSPDALSSISASISGSANVNGKVQAALAAGWSEAAANIGLRTQSIQLMRDAMYRLCEGYVSGIISGEQFETLHRRFQNSTVAILAIEQLTGAVRGPSARLGGSSSISKADAVVKVTEMLAGERKALMAAHSDQVSADEAAAAARADPAFAGVDPNELDDDKRPLYEAAKKKVDSADAAAEAATMQVADRKRSVSSLEKALTAVEAGDLSAVATASGEGSQVQPLSDESAKAVANAIVSIVNQAFSLPFQRDVCATQALMEIKYGNAKGVSSSAECSDYNKMTNASLRSYIELREAVTGNIKNQTAHNLALNTEQIRLLIGIGGIESSGSADDSSAGDAQEMNGSVARKSKKSAARVPKKEPVSTTQTRRSSFTLPSPIN